MFSLRHAARRIALVAVSTIALAACGDDDEPTAPSLPDLGDAFVTVTLDGDDTTYTGSMGFVAGEDGFGLILNAWQAEGPGVQIFLARENGTRPGAGRLTIDDVSVTQAPPLNNLGAQVRLFRNGEEVLLWSTGGSVRIVRSSPDAVAGTFTMTAVGCFNCGTEAESVVPVQFEGAFNAPPAVVAAALRDAATPRSRHGR